MNVFVHLSLRSIKVYSLGAFKNSVHQQHFVWSSQFNKNKPVSTNILGIIIQAVVHQDWVPFGLMIILLVHVGLNKSHTHYIFIYSVLNTHFPQFVTFFSY